jgi:hypothetical protein
MDLETVIKHRYSNIFYNNGWNGVFNQSDSIAIDQITELKKYKLLIFDFSQDHWGPYTGGPLPIYNTLKDLELNFIFLTHNDSNHLVEPNYLFYPYWYYFSLTVFSKNYLQNINSDSKKYKISCLNGGARFHRIYNYIKLSKKHYFNELYISMHNIHAWRHDDFHLSDEQITEWSSVKVTFPITQLGHKEVTDIDDDAYTNSYINLVTETTVITNLNISEKSWKPIASGQLFVIIGSMGIIGHLRQQGVDTFDDIIDHDYYDNEPNWEIRINKVHEIVDKLMLSDLQKINEMTRDRRINNAQKFFAGEFDKIYHKCLLDKIDEYYDA